MFRAAAQALLPLAARGARPGLLLVGIRTSVVPAGLHGRRHKSDSAAPAQPPAGPSELVPTSPSLTDQLATFATTVDPQSLSGVPHLGEVREAGMGALYTPVGLIQNLVEAASAIPGVPWGVGIILTTVVIRTALFPVILKVMRNNVIMANIRPEVELHSNRMTTCNKAGDKQGALMAQQQLVKLFQDNNCHPLKSFLGILAQAPIFISMFIGLRKMSELPIESMRNGGFAWFSDITVPDPYYVLPAVASATMLATILLGADGAPTKQQATFKWFIIVITVALLPVTVNFPAAIFLYWVPSNFLSLFQTVLFKSNAVRSCLSLPKPIVHAQLPSAPKPSFVESLKNSYESAKEQAETTQREREAAQRQEALKNMKIPKKRPS